MPCVRPAWMNPIRKLDGDQVVYTYKFGKYKDEGALIDPSTGAVYESFPVACGKCYSCVAKNKEVWTTRLLDEVSLYDHSCMITLTYRDKTKESEEVLDLNGKPFDLRFPDGHVELLRKDVQLFVKRLRQALGDLKIRIFYCGEYGSKNKRPHYHLIIFGFDFPDKIDFHKDKKGFMMQRSFLLEKLWHFGMPTIVPVGEGTLPYVVKDMQKLRTDGIEAFTPPFVGMSTKPGIGIGAWNRSVPSDGKIWKNGHSVFLPRYYRKVAQREGISLAPFAKAISKIVPVLPDKKKDDKKLLTLRHKFDIIK